MEWELEIRGKWNGMGMGPCLGYAIIFQSISIVHINRIDKHTTQCNLHNHTVRMTFAISMTTLSQYKSPLTPPSVPPPLRSLPSLIGIHCKNMIPLEITIIKLNFNVSHVKSQ